MELADIETALAGNEEALTLVKDLASKAALITPELEADLPKLGEYKAAHEKLTRILGETKAKDADALLTDFTALKTAKTDLEAKIKTAGKAGGTDTPEYRALMEQLEEVKGQLGEMKAKSEQAEQAAAAAAKEKAETDLKASIIGAASKHKAIDGEEDFIILKAKGLTGFGEDGKPFFYKLNDSGEKVAVKNADEMLSAYYAKRLDRVAGSGTKGTGNDHRGNGGDQKRQPKSHADAVREAMS